MRLKLFAPFAVALAYADFVEPDRPLMHSVGKPLCDYVLEVVQGAALPKR